MTGTDPLVLSDETLAGLGITPPEVADAIEAAIAEKAAGRLHVTPKSAILPGGARYMMSTLAVGDDAGLTVLKAVTVSPDNPARGLPTINGAIMALDAQTGLLRAVLGANWVTAVRTAALSAVAARRLANPDARSIGFIGAGVQALSHLDAFAAEYPIEAIRIFGRGQANIDRLTAAAADKGITVHVAATPREAIEDVDMVATAVTLDYSIEPFLDAAWLKPGAFAAITDLMIPWTPESVAAFTTVVVDDREQERTAEKPMVPYERVSADLAELAGGGTGLGFDSNVRAAFAFRGMALGDYAATALALSRAETGKNG